MSDDKYYFHYRWKTNFQAQTLRKREGKGSCYNNLCQREKQQKSRWKEPFVGQTKLLYKIGGSNEREEKKWARPTSQSNRALRFEGRDVSIRDKWRGKKKNIYIIKKRRKKNIGRTVLMIIYCFCSWYIYIKKKKKKNK